MKIFFRFIKETQCGNLSPLEKEYFRRKKKKQKKKANIPLYFFATQSPIGERDQIFNLLAVRINAWYIPSFLGMGRLKAFSLSELIIWGNKKIIHRNKGTSELQKKMF